MKETFKSEFVPEFHTLIKLIGAHQYAQAVQALSGFSDGKQVDKHTGVEVHYRGQIQAESNPPKWGDGSRNHSFASVTFNDPRIRIAFDDEAARFIVDIVDDSEDRYLDRFLVFPEPHELRKAHLSDHDVEFNTLNGSVKISFLR